MRLLDKLNTYVSAHTNQQINQRIVKNILKINDDIVAVNSVINDHFIPVLKEMLTDPSVLEHVAAKEILDELHKLRQTAHILVRTCDRVNYWVNWESPVTDEMKIQEVAKGITYEGDCPMCGHEFTYDLDDITEFYFVRCPKCDKHLRPCAMCQCCSDKPCESAIRKIVTEAHMKKVKQS